MANINVDMRELEMFKNQLGKNINMSAVYDRTLSELAARLLRKVIERTPVGKDSYVELLVWRKDKNGNARVVRQKDDSSKARTAPVKTYSGGTLKKNWFAGTVSRVAGLYEINVYNNIYYASYVEYGHRQRRGRYVPAIGKRLVKSWVNGRFMMTISAKEIKQIAPALIQKRIEEYLRKAFV